MDAVADWWHTGTRRAYVVGASEYDGSIPRLITPRGDANAVADLLRRSHGYVVDDNRLTSGVVGKDRVVALLRKMQAEVGPDDRVVFYFAGHGVPPDVVTSRAGYLVPEDARREDANTFLAMNALYEYLASLPCRHLLIVLDCCFAGSFRWVRTRPQRDLAYVPEGRIYLERFRRLLDRRAWQLLTSAGAHELAADILFGQRDAGGEHSPFAETLLQGLSGDADYRVRGTQIVRDGVITLGKLVDYVADRMRHVSGAQTVGYAPLERHDDGEFLFLTPGTNPAALALPSLRPSLRADNPYLGLRSYDFTGLGARKIYGRDDALETLTSFVRSHALTVVTGASGTGKSSLVCAGLMRELATHSDWIVSPPIRPGRAPFAAFAAALTSQQPFPPGVAHEPSLSTVRDWIERSAADRQVLFCIDPLEDLVTHLQDSRERERFCAFVVSLLTLPRVRLVLIVRSDFERRFNPNTNGGMLFAAWADRWELGRFQVPPLTDEELRAAIRGPANERAVNVEESVVDALVRETGGRVGELPLLAATLQELYSCCVERIDITNSSSWTISERDYASVGGVAGGLIRRFEHVLATQRSRPEGDHTATLRRILLRMVNQEGLILTKRQVPKTELAPARQTVDGGDEAARIDRVLRSLGEARLIVFDTRLGDRGTEEVVEPAHDAAVRGWPRMSDDWLRDVQSRADDNLGLSIPQRRRLTEDAARWKLKPAPDKDPYTWATSPALAAATRELRDQPLEYNAAEVEFLEASLRRREVARRRTRARVALVLLVVLALTAVSVVVFTRARELGRDAESRRLASLADTVGATSLDLAALLGVQSTRIRPTAEAKASVLRALLREPRLIRHYVGQHGHVEFLAFGPNAIRLASASSQTSRSSNGRLVVWDVESGASIGTHPLPFQVMALAVSPDDRHVALATAEGRIQLLNYLTGDRRDWIPPAGRVSFEDTLAFDASGEHLLASSNQRVWRLDIPTGRDTTHSLTGHVNRAGADRPDALPNVVLIHSDGRTVDSGGDDGLLLRHDLLTGTHVRLAALEARVTALALDPVSGRLASGTVNGQITVLDGIRRIHIRSSDGNEVKRVRIAERGDQVAAEIEAADGSSSLVSWRVGEGVRALPIEHPGLLHDFDLTQDYVATGGLDSQLRIHGAADGQLSGPPMVGHGQRVYRVAFAPGKPAALATSGDDGIVILWDAARSSRLTASGTPDLNLPSAIELLTFSPSGFPAGGGREGVLFATSTKSSTEIWHSPDRDQMFRRMAFSADGQVLAAGGEADGLALLDRRVDRGPRFIRTSSNVKAIHVSADGGTVRTLDMSAMLRSFRSSDGAELSVTSLVAEGNNARAMREAVFSDDGEQIAVGYDSGEVFVANGLGARLRPLFNHAKQVSALSYSPDGTILASAGENTIWLNDVNTGRTFAVLLDRHRSAINALSVSREGQMLAAGCVDGSILLFDIPTGQQLGVIPAHSDAIFAIAFDRATEHLLSGGLDKRMKRWELDFDASIQRSAYLSGRNLTGAEWKQFVGANAPYERTFPQLPDGDGVTAEMKTQRQHPGRWIVGVAFLAWIPFTFLVPWSSVRQITSRPAWGAASIVLLCGLIGAVLVPNQLSTGASSMWLDRAVRLGLLAAFGVVAAWVQQFLDLDPSRFWAGQPAANDRSNPT